MQKVKVVCVGKLKEDYLRAACAEYQKRIGRYASLSVVELPEANFCREPGPAEIAEILSREGRRILQAVAGDQNVVLLCIEGPQQTSEAFSRRLLEAPLRGDTLTFVIGGSYGLSEEVKRAYPQKLSFSQMTFPHQLMRVILLEQIYRGFQILTGGQYHK